MGSKWQVEGRRAAPAVEAVGQLPDLCGRGPRRGLGDQPPHCGHGSTAAQRLRVNRRELLGGDTRVSEKAPGRDLPGRARHVRHTGGRDVDDELRFGQCNDLASGPPQHPGTGVQAHRRGPPEDQVHAIGRVGSHRLVRWLSVIVRDISLVEFEPRYGTLRVEAGSSIRDVRWGKVTQEWCGSPRPGSGCCRSTAAGSMSWSR